MDKYLINATKRSLTGKKVKSLRREGKLPGVIYGKHTEPTSILMDTREASKILNEHSFVTLNLDGEEVAALVQEKQRDFLRGNLLHVDFHAVSMTEKLTTTVEIVSQGIPSAVKNYNAVLVQNLNELEVECFPQDLPEKIVVDVAKLANIGSSILVKDLVLPAAVQVLSHADTVVFVAVGVGEEKAEEAVPSAEGPEIIEKGKKEEEEAE